MMSEWTVLTPKLRCQVGEGPIWVAPENALYWVDIVAPALHRLALADGTTATWVMPEMIGFVVPRADAPGFLIGLQSGVAALTFDPLTITPFLDPEPERPGNRLNDATVDAAGRLWAGTMAPDGATPSGALYRLDPDLTSHRVDDGYLIPNGPAFGPGGIFYHADSGKRLIYRFEATANGGLADRRVHIAFDDPAWGLPDGMTVDAEGCLWVAHWDGARLSRFDPDGALIRHIALPAPRVTSCVFGGIDNDRLFVTSAALSYDAEPHAGCVFEVDPGVRGVAIPDFAQIAGT